MFNETWHFRPNEIQIGEGVSTFSNRVTVSVTDAAEFPSQCLPVWGSAGPDAVGEHIVAHLDDGAVEFHSLVIKFVNRVGEILCFRVHGCCCAAIRMHRDDTFTPTFLIDTLPWHGTLANISIESFGFRI